MTAPEILSKCRDLVDREAIKEHPDELLIHAEKFGVPIHSLLILLGALQKFDNDQKPAELTEGWITRQVDVPDELLHRISELAQKGYISNQERKSIFTLSRSLEIPDSEIKVYIDEKLAEVNSFKSREASKKKNLILFVGLSLFLMVACTILYYFLYLPWKTEKDAPRAYVLPNGLNFRSSQTTSGESNLIAKLPYGTEVIVLGVESDSSWARVKVGEEYGYLGQPTKYLASKQKFFEVDGLLGNQDAKEIIANSFVKTALWQYCNQNQIMGVIAPELQTEFYGAIKNWERWQILALPKESKFNASMMGKLTGSDQKVVALILTKENREQRRLVLFQFDSNDHGSLIFEMTFPPEFDGIAYVAAKKSLRIKTPRGNLAQKLAVPCILFGSNDVYNNNSQQVLYYNGTGFQLNELAQKVIMN